jgi:isopentenyl phosphate kinase
MVTIEHNLIFLKLGGSLITQKSLPHTARPEVIHRLASEIAAARQDNPRFKILLGHGSGSFGHIPAKLWKTRNGVKTSEAWIGFVEVWHEADALNQIVMQALKEVSLPAISFTPSSSVTASDGKVADWNLTPIQKALEADIIPVIYGDVIFDAVRGGTILSTEDLFEYLAPKFLPSRILLAGLEKGVWADYPQCTELIPEITQANIEKVKNSLGDSSAPDVTGGMTSKVSQSLRMVEEVPNLDVLIFSGEIPNNVLRAIQGVNPGTLLTKKQS